MLSRHHRLESVPTMTFRNASGTVLTKTAFLALAPVEPTPEAKYRLTAPIYETYSLNGEKPGTNFESGKRLLFKTGDVLTQTQIDNLFQAAGVATVSPASGPAAGNTVITVTGTNLAGASGITVGGVACTEFTVLSNTQVRGKTGAHAAGAVSVVVADDSGPATKAAGFTYT